MKFNLIRHVFILFTSSFLILLINFASGILLARLLGADGRGMLAQIQSWVLFLASLGNFGVPKALVYYVSKDIKDIGSFITSAWLILMPLSVFWAYLLFQLLPILLSRQPTITIAFAQVFVLYLPIAYFTHVASVFFASKQFTLISIMDLHRPLILSVSWFILFILGLSNVYIVVFITLFSSVLSPVMFLILKHYSGIKLGWPRFVLVRRLLTFGVRALLSQLPTVLNNRVDQLILASFLPAPQVGLYVVSVSWSLILSGIFAAISRVLFPYLAGEKNANKRRQILVRNLRWSFVLSIVLALFLLGITPVMLPFFFGSEFSEAVPVAMLLIVASIFFNLKLVLADAMNGLGQPGKTAYAEICALGITLIGLGLTLPVLGIMGAALTSLFAYLCATLLLLYFVKKHTQLGIYTLLIPTCQDMRQLFLVLRKIIQWVEAKVKRHSEAIKYE